MKTITPKLIVVCSCILFITSCRKDLSDQQAIHSAQMGQARTSISDSDNYIATSWMDFELNLIKTTSTIVPPISSRAIGYTGLTMYQSMLYSKPGHSSLVGQLNGLKSLPKPDSTQSYRYSVTLNAAVAHLLRYLFDNMSGTNSTALTALENANNDLLGNTTADDFIRSAAYGVTLADSIIAYSKKDGGDHGYLRIFPSSYIPPVGPQYWIPQSDQGPVPMLPYWGNNYTFKRNVAKLTQPIEGPDTFSTDTASDYYKAAYNVYMIGNTLTQEQADIADFWDDGSPTITPPGHSTNILTQIIQNQNLSLFEATRAYARMGLALSDAFVSCWKTKYTYSAIRPSTYINLYIDATWNPRPSATGEKTNSTATPWVSHIHTPPHPEYSSGHAVQTGAATAILRGLFGANTGFTDHSHDVDGKAPRSFTNFDAFESEVANSRVFGGIHYQKSCNIGVQQGEAVGAYFLKLKM